MGTQVFDPAEQIPVEAHTPAPQEVGNASIVPSQLLSTPSQSSIEDWFCDPPGSVEQRTDEDPAHSLTPAPHAPTPSQAAPIPNPSSVSPSQSSSALLQASAGPDPKRSALHVPSRPAWLQAWQAPEQPMSQQKPSEQKPFSAGSVEPGRAHWLLLRHASPTGRFGWQLVAPQKKPAAQSPSLAQALRQAPLPSQVKPLQPFSGSVP